MHLRRFSASLLALALLFTARVSRAQMSAYGAVALDGFGFTGTNYPSSGSFKGDTAGVIGGAFYTFRSGSRFKAGLDGRLMYSAGYKGGSAYTGALRVSFVPNRNRLRPYLQIGGGVASTQLHETICNGFSCGIINNRISNGVAQIVFGLDIRASDRVDIRAFDYGADAGGSRSSADAAAAFLDAGVVYHFGR